jgi:hypothetical protein
MYFLLKAMRYSKYGWKICGHLKVTGLLQGMHSGCKSFAVFFVNGPAEQKTNIAELRISHA